MADINGVIAAYESQMQRAFHQDSRGIATPERRAAWRRSQPQPLDAIRTLFGDQPTVAQAKAEAVREAVKAIRGAWDDSWNLRDPEDPETAYSVDVWLSKYADRIERGE